VADELADTDAYWLKRGAELLAAARKGEHEGGELACDVTGWPDTWIAADLLTYDNGTEHELAAANILDQPHAITATPQGDVVELLARAEAASGDERIAALEAAWRACFAPELADVIEALDAHRAAPAMPKAKKKKDTEALWATAATTATPRSLFDGEWPTQWRDAQRRMRPIYARPRSPLFAAAAIEFAKRDPLPYTSIASSPYWQAHAWFIAEQCDVRQLAALEAFEQRMAPMRGPKNLVSDALRKLEPRALPAKAQAMLAKLAVAKPAQAPKISLASAEDRSVAADQLLLAGDPRGEFITVQEQISKEPTAALVKRQNQLLKKHAKTWVPGTVYRDTCVFRGGVPVAGHLIARSDPELAGMAGSKALATFETLVIDASFAMGEIEPSTIAAVVASLPNLRHVITSDRGASAIWSGAPTSLERITFEGDGPAAFEGPGLPKLVRVDAKEIPKKWSMRSWYAQLTAVGCEDPASWKTWRKAKLAKAVVLTNCGNHLRSTSASGPTPWELWAENGVVTAKHQAGSNAKSLAATLEAVSWEGVTELRVPESFLKVATPIAVKQKIPSVSAIAAVDPRRDGSSLDLA
jgi:hypothetical protein